jgi:predicted nucleotidyltransferase
LDKSDELNHAKNFISKVLETLPVRSAWLYGSWVYGSPDKESDIDVAILLDTTSENILDTEKNSNISDEPQI